MKKSIFSLVLLLLMAAAPAKAGIEFGVMTGMNMSKVNFHKFNKNFDSSNRYGWYFGPKVNFSVLGFGGDAAVVYSQLRMNLDDNYSKTFRSIEIPVNARYTFGLSSLASVYVATGPQLGFNIGNKDWTWKSITTPENNVLGSTFTRKNMNVSWNFGAGVKVFKHLEAGLNYNLMLSKYAHPIKVVTGHEVSASDYNFHTNTFSVRVAYLF